MIPLLLAGAAFANEPSKAPHGAGAAHAPAATHASAEGGEHGGGHGGHHYYTDDDDHDGTPNWMDATTGSEPNTETYVLKSVGLHALNLAVLLAVLGYVARRPFVDFWRDRALGIRKELTDSAEKRDEARRRHQEVMERLSKIEGEVTTMLETATVEAKREEEQLVERARREAARISEQAERNIRDEVVRARASLRQEAVELAVRLAEATLRGTTSDADQQALARAFLKSVDEGERRV
jgi:F-type H+-transporting ATPase subunit b